jgi:RNA polymerase sigma-70 factor (family 1)
LAKQENLIEKVLISKLKSGSKDAFSVIFITYYKDLVLFATNFTHEIDTAEEIVQDTFLKIWEDHEAINIKVSIKSYLLKAVQNRCIDWFRHVKIQQKFENETLINSINYEFNTDNYLINSEIEGLIRDALNKLPAEISQAYRMHRYEGLKYQEISERLNVSVRTVEVRIGKALSSLRDELREYLVDNSD